MLEILLLKCICAFLIFSVLRHALKRYQLSSFPQSPSIFLIGDKKLMFRFPLEYWIFRSISELADDFVDKGKILIGWITVIPVFATFNKDYIKTILAKNDSEYLDKGKHVFYPVWEDLLPNSLFTIEGSRWKVRRKLLSQPFHPSNMNNFVKIVNFESRRMIESIKNKEIKNVIRETKKIALYTYFKLLFEYDLGDEISLALKLSDQVLKLLGKKTFSIFLISPFLYRFTSMAKEETKMANEYLELKMKILNAKTNLKEELEKKLESKKETLLGKAKNLSLIEILLMNLKGRIDEKVAGWPGFDIKEITSQMDNFIIAGVDTQSLALCYLFYDLAKHPDWQERIYEEIQQVCCDNNKNDHNSTPDVTLDQIKNMPLLEAFVQESMRLKPVIQAVIRHIRKEIKLDENYTIPADSDVAILLEKVLTDPDYFPDPFAFKPDRFLGDQEDNLYTNIPFSAGPRNCIAKKVALQVQSIVTANLLKQLRIEVAPSTPDRIRFIFEVVNRPMHDIGLKFVQRY